ncbi:MAG: protein-L-isoaspartate(D-aspartate) O-methyltransferase [Deltaproteobacteria bacterium]|nr:MAG: protein-L-isoaspartate(D-aspartate) O-methyltransferase [Deltaproteobacteria bacterium]
MVDLQIRGRGVKDEKLLSVMEKIPRHLFVPESLRDRAYDDCPLPIGENQTISQPYIVALMTEALSLTGKEKVLELGTGSGYQAAILAELAEKVITIERIPTLAERAEKVLKELGYENVRVITGDGTLGYEEEAPYDRVIITAATPDFPPPVVEQLKEGGVIVGPLGGAFEQELVRGVKKKGRVEKTFLGGCRFVKLLGEYGFRS